MREKISITDTLPQVVGKMADGNIGALSVLTDICKSDTANAFISILGLDDMNIRGEQIWLGFKYFSNSDIEEFRKNIKERSLEMVNSINKQCTLTERAVTSGASFSRGSRKKGARW